MSRASTRKSLGKSFCDCIKQVRQTVKARGVKRQSAKAKESAAIAICVKSVLQTKGKTLRKFKCGKRPYLQTRKLFSKKV